MKDSNHPAEGNRGHRPRKSRGPRPGPAEQAPRPRKRATAARRESGPGRNSAERSSPLSSLSSSGEATKLAETIQELTAQATRIPRSGSWSYASYPSAAGGKPATADQASSDSPGRGPKRRRRRSFPMERRPQLLRAQSHALACFHKALLEAWLADDMAAYHELERARTAALAALPGLVLVGHQCGLFEGCP